MQITRQLLIETIKEAKEYLGPWSPLEIQLKVDKVLEAVESSNYPDSRDFETALKQIILNATDDDLAWIKKPDEWQQWAVDQVYDAMRATMENSIAKQLREYDPHVEVPE